MKHEPIAPAAEARPASAVGAGTGMSGLAGLGLWTLWCHHRGLDGPYASLVAVASGALPMIGWSLLVERVHRRPSTGLDWQAPPRPWRDVWDGTLTKLAGLWATWGLVALCYAVGRWYWQPPALFAMEVLRAALPLLVIGSVPYLLWVERRLVEPQDGLWHFGRALSGRGWTDPAARAAIAGHLRAWAVKGFFTAFMIQCLPGNWLVVMAVAPAQWLRDPAALADGLVGVMFLVDVTVATAGYLLTMRPLDTHIRSANPYLSAWGAALICYPPLVMVMGRGGPLDYQPDFQAFRFWLGGHPLLLSLHAFLLIALTGIYAWATLAFGLRFSNLTNRGILTNGPYRWTKHPAYLAKNLYWWLAALPFLPAAGSWGEALRNAAILAAISAVYYARARTEERHLLADPDYRAYADWAARHAPVTCTLSAAARRVRQYAASS